MPYASRKSKTRDVKNSPRSHAVTVSACANYANEQSGGGVVMPMPLGVRLGS